MCERHYKILSLAKRIKLQKKKQYSFIEANHCSVIIYPYYLPSSFSIGSRKSL